MNYNCCQTCHDDSDNAPHQRKFTLIKVIKREPIVEDLIFLQFNAKVVEEGKYSKKSSGTPKNDYSMSSCGFE
jgi:hypothetical protein